MIYYRWTEEHVMEPLAKFAEDCALRFKIGHIYRLQEVKERSQKSHDHYFAVLAEAWLQLPESLMKHFKNNETKFRKWALIEAGCYTERVFAMKTVQDAAELAAYHATVDEYAEIIVEGELVSIRTAKSQKIKRVKNGDDTDAEAAKEGMDAREFQESKEKVLEVVGKLIGVHPAELRRKAGMAA